MGDDPTGHTYTFEPDYAGKIWDTHHTKKRGPLGEELKAAAKAGRHKESVYLERLWWYLHGWGAIGRGGPATKDGFLAAAKPGVETAEMHLEDEDPRGGRKRTQKRKATQKKRRKSRRTH